MDERKRVGADQVHARVKLAINDLARVVFELRDARGVEHHEVHDQDAFDALDDAGLITCELAGLWDRLWGAIGDERTDGIPWEPRLRAALELREALEGRDEEVA